MPPLDDTLRVEDVARAIGILVPLALVLAVYVAMTRDNVRLLRGVNNDDWRGVRDAATALTARDSAWIPRATRAQARQLLGLAHHVLGDLPAARAAHLSALATNLLPPIEAATTRQLASVERAMGDFGAARARLASPDACASDRDRHFVAVQLAQVLIDSGEPAAAEQAILPAIMALEARGAGARTFAMRTAFAADLIQARCSLVRARIERGDVAGAGEVWDSGMTGFSDPHKPYVHGQLAETGARLALLRGDRTTASELAEVASGRFDEVGARVDVVRMDVLRARISRDRAALDAAERELRRLGGLGYVPDVEQARLDIEGLG